MKKTRIRKLKSTAMTVLCLLLSMLYTACGGSDAAPDSVSFNVNGLTFTGTANEPLTVTVYASTDWQVTYCPEWLSPSSRGGSSGTFNLVLTTTKANETTADITGVVQITAGSATAELQVTQISPYPKDCSAKPEEHFLRIMSYGVACSFQCSPNCNRYRWHIYNDHDFELVRGDNAAIEQAAKSWEAHTPDENFVLAVNNLEPNTRYHLVTIAYAMSGQRGEIVERAFDTMSGDEEAKKQQATISMESFTVSKDGKDVYQWSVEKDAMCDKYYTYICVGRDKFKSYKLAEATNNGYYSDRNGIWLAWNLYQDILESDQTRTTHYNYSEQDERSGLGREKVFNYRTSNDVFSFEASSGDKYIEVLTWGVRNNTFSGLLYDKIYEIKSDGTIEDKDNPTVWSLEMTSATSMTFAPTPSEPQEIVMAGNDSWKVTASEKWCIVSPSEGAGNGTIKVKPDRNGSKTQRTATVTIKGTKTQKTFTVSIIQNGQTDESEIGREEYGSDVDGDNNSGTSYSFTVDNTNLSFTSYSSSQNISISGNDSWTASSNAAWCTLGSTSGTAPSTLNIKVSENTASSTRSAVVTLKGSHTGKSISIYVAQSGTSYSLSVSPTSLSFSDAASTQYITVTGTDKWTATSGNTSWCTVSPASGTGAGTISVKVSKHTGSSSRSTNITIKGTNSGTSYTVSVTQSNKDQSEISREDYGSERSAD